MLLAQGLPYNPASNIQSHSYLAEDMSVPTNAPIALPDRFIRVKEALIAGKEKDVIASWKRLLAALRDEIDVIAATGSDIIPSINSDDLSDTTRFSKFSSQLKSRGAAVIRQVVKPDKAKQWKEELDFYLDGNPQARCLPTRDPHLYGVYWSPAQVKARADPDILSTQRLLMNLWTTSDPEALITPNFPVTYADRLRIWSMGESSHSLNAHIDGGSVERWEPDGYGLGSTYKSIWDGKWEDYDPWESSTRLKVTSDLYNGAGSCSMFRMFQGWLSLNHLPPGDGSLLLCPMIRLSTAYVLLRPFFSPIQDSPSNPDFLSPENWKLEKPMSSVIHGALPSYTQELNESLHPHLDLRRSMVQIPRLNPGDYLVWHCDAVYAFDPTQRPSEPDATVIYLPACPLTQTNALYLARQRKAFLLGQSSPDFGGSHGESTHMGRPGVQEVHDAGGEDGLRSMGLLPWEEVDAADDCEEEMIEMANGILFPDRYDINYCF